MSEVEQMPLEIWTDINGNATRTQFTGGVKYIRADERDRLIKEYVRLFRLCEPIAKMLSEVSILPIGCSREQELAWKMAVKNFRHYQRDYAADVLLQAALTPAGQRWTRMKPTEPGWYWYLYENFPQVVHVDKWPTGKELRATFPGMFRAKPIDKLQGEWQGPLTPNEATE